MNASLAYPTIPIIGSPYDLRVGLSAAMAEKDVRATVEAGQFGFVHSFTPGSAVDGPGIRIVAWLTGCQFRCVYCPSPDTWKMTNGMLVPLSRAMEVISQCRHDLKTAHGGLTISGGEPLMQCRFVLNLFDAAQKMGLHTALDTNGYLGAQLSDSDLESIDLVLLDLKAMTPELHWRLTGMDNRPIHEFARRLAARHRPIWVRFVLVPDWTDRISEIDRLADFAAELGNVERVEVLPFHQMGRFKWEKLKMDYQLETTQPPSRESVNDAVARFRAVGLQAF